jgi:hypothetical protein
VQRNSILDDLRRFGLLSSLEKNEELFLKRSRRFRVTGDTPLQTVIPHDSLKSKKTTYFDLDGIMDIEDFFIKSNKIKILFPKSSSQNKCVLG